MAKNNKKSKNLLLLVILLAIVGIAVGYAALSRTLILNGTAEVATGDEAWNVHFVAADSVVTQNCAAGDAVMASTDGTTGTFSASLIPGETVTYTVATTNDGTIPAKYDDYLVTDKTTGDNNYVTCTVTPVDTTATLHDGVANGEHTFTVTMKCADMTHAQFDALSEAGGLVAKFQIDFNYSQAN